jgi:hypothetical protein
MRRQKLPSNTTMSQKSNDFRQIMKKAVALRASIHYCIWNARRLAIGCVWIKFLRMLIDRTHRNWSFVTAVLFVAAVLLYVAYARTWPNGPSGRTLPGMLFGVVGTLLMVFAGLLAVRKKTVRLRLGSLSWWLKGHLWLGLLSVPLIFFHTAFRWGGWLEILLWLTYGVVIVSGIVGLALQNVLPRVMKIQLPSEAIPDQFREVCRRLILTADEKVLAQCTPMRVEAFIAGTAKSVVAAQADPLDVLANFYLRSVRPFLGPSPADRLLATSEQAQQVFDQVRASLPDTCHATVDGLEQLCQDRRELAQQQWLYRWLHGWLKIHVPFSVALLVFAVIHVVTALYY